LTDGNPTDPGRNIYQSETGEITIEAPLDRMTLDTPRTAGGFAPAGQSIHTAHGVRITVQDTDATVWVSALDDQPITTSGRLLVTHLTDLQNTEIRYAERARQTLLDWGQLPHLVRAGKAEVRIRLPDPAAYRVWALIDQRPARGQRRARRAGRRTGLPGRRSRAGRSRRRVDVRSHLGQIGNQSEVIPQLLRAPHRSSTGGILLCLAFPVILVPLSEVA
jgi:hypothetical protein